MSRVAVTDLARCESGARCENIAVGLCLSRSCVLCYVFPVAFATRWAVGKILH